MNNLNSKIFLSNTCSSKEVQKGINAPLKSCPSADFKQVIKIFVAFVSKGSQE